MWFHNFFNVQRAPEVNVFVPSWESRPGLLWKWDYFKDLNIRQFFLQRRSVLKWMSPRLASGLHDLHNSLFANSPWLWPTNCEFGNSKPSAESYVCVAVQFYLPKQRMQSFGDISLTVWSLKNIPALPIHFSEQTIYCCRLDPVNLNDPCNSPKETLQLKWSILFHGLCPNDWWHFLRHFQRQPLANLECHVNAKIFPCQEQSHILTLVSMFHISMCLHDSLLHYRNICIIAYKLSTKKHVYFLLSLFEMYIFIGQIWSCGINGNFFYCIWDHSLSCLINLQFIKETLIGTNRYVWLLTAFGCEKEYFPGDFDHRKLMNFLFQCWSRCLVRNAAMQNSLF